MKVKSLQKSERNLFNLYGTNYRYKIVLSINTLNSLNYYGNLKENMGAKLVVQILSVKLNKLNINYCW